jgi:hypothetical protein
MLLLSVTLHVKLICLFGMLKLTSNVVIDNVFVVVNMIARSIYPDCNHEDCPDQEKYQEDG